MQPCQANSFILKEKTAYDIYQCDWSSDVCSSDLNFLFWVGHARGTQGYVCLPTAAGASTASWTVKGARPEATLFPTIFGQSFQVVTHFLSPDTNPNDVAPNPLPFGSAT